jgi:phage terminase large subunit-like protein
MAKNERAERVIAFIERYCLIPEGEHVGKPIQLAEFQKEFIRDIYRGGVRRAYLSIARKNGKTALIGALVLAHLVGPEAVRNSQIVSGARSRDQAALVFNLAAKMIQLNPKLAEIVRIIPSGKRLIGLPMNVEYRALAADGTTAHGLSPVLAILDEVGQVRGPRDDFIDAITTSQGAHKDPLLVAISTQAPTDADLFSLWIDDAKQHKDPRTVCHVHAAPEDADLLDEEGWKAANPALGLFRSIDDVREQAEQAARMPSAENTFRNLTLNQRVAVLSPFVSREVWASCGEEVAPMDGPLYGGLDLSARTDLTAFSLVYRWGDDWHVRSFFWTPEKGLLDRAKRDRVPYDLWVEQGYLRTTPGSTVDYEFVAQEIADIVGAGDLRAVAFDRWRIDLFTKELDRLGLTLPLVSHGQGFKDMSPALDDLEAALLNGKLRHGNHPVLTMCAANAVVTKDPAGNRKLDKGKANGRIDGMVALAMALAAAAGEEVEDDITEFLKEPLRVW